MADGDTPDTLAGAQDPTQQQNPIAGTPVNVLPPQQQQQPIRAPNLADYRMPLIAKLISGMANANKPMPNQQPGQPPMMRPSRLDAFEDFLGNFMYSLSQGMAASGHGPGANLRGAAAAIGAPMQRDIGQYNLNQQAANMQAAREQEQARTGLEQKQTEMMGQMVTVQTPQGPMMMPYQIALRAMPQVVRGQFGEDIAGKNIASREGIAQDKITSQEKIAGEKIAATPQTSKVDPIIAAQVGLPPNSSAYAGGANDPKYKQDSQAWGTRAEAIKNRMASASAAARGEAYGMFRPVQAINPDTGETSWMFAKQAITGGAAPAGAGATAMSKQAQFQEMKSASSKFRDAINNLDVDFTPVQRAKLTLAMRAPNESVLQNEVTGLLGTEQLTAKQQDFVIWATQMHERILSLRNVAGIGQGSDQVRNALQATIPGVTTANKKYAIKQMDAVDNQISQLEKGIPKVRGMGGGGGVSVEDLLKKYPPK